MSKTLLEKQTETKDAEDAERERIRLPLSLVEAQIVFTILGDAILPKRSRNAALKVYQRLQSLGFIDDF